MRIVHWDDDVLNDLAELWLQGDAALRKAITKAVHTVEKRLANNAER